MYTQKISRESRQMFDGR